MYRLILGIAAGLLLFSNNAMAVCSSYPYTLTNGATADASQVMANFNCAALTSGATLVNVTQLGIGSALTGLAGISKLNIVSSANASGINSSSNSILVLHNDTSMATGVQVSPTGLVIARDKSSAVVNGDYLGGLSWNARYDSEVRAGYANISAVARGSGVAALTFNVPSSALSPTEAVRIDYNGYVGVGTTTPGYLLHVAGTAYATGAAGALSDIRHKMNISPLRAGALDDVMRLQPVTFYWREPKDQGMQGRQMGFIAQEVERIAPTAVLTQDNAEKTKGLKYNELIALLTKAMQEQQAQIQALKTEGAIQVRALKAANDNQHYEIGLLRSQIVSLESKVRVQTAAR